MCVGGVLGISLSLSLSLSRARARARARARVVLQSLLFINFITSSSSHIHRVYNDIHQHHGHMYLCHARFTELMVRVDDFIAGHTEGRENTLSKGMSKRRRKVRTDPSPCFGMCYTTTTTTTTTTITTTTTATTTIPFLDCLRSASSFLSASSSRIMVVCWYPSSSSSLWLGVKH